jgi:hypothetical protein
LKRKELHSIRIPTLAVAAQTPSPRLHDKQLKRFGFEGAEVTVDLLDGAPIAVHPTGRNHFQSFLLDEKSPWFHPPHRWGRGFLLLAGARAAKWGQPDRVSISEKRVRLRYHLENGIDLDVKRSFGRRWLETYTWRNTSASPLSITSLAIRTPFRDVYASAKASLRDCCHAHIFPGGAYGFVWATPMSGVGPSLGLRLTAGAIWAYSVEGRNPVSSSNFRGHLLLHATDAARAPSAFGGQPVLRIDPGESYSLAWEIALYDSWDAFAARWQFPAAPDRVSAVSGEPIRLNVRPKTRVGVSPGFRLRRDRGSTAVQAIGKRLGEHYLAVDGPRGPTRLALHCHAPIRVLVEKRIDFILERQRAVERRAPRNASFLPYDVSCGLRIDGGEWQDWSDARERLAMPVLLQQARRLGWHREDVLDLALARFSEYAAQCLIGPQGVAMENSYYANPDRLYNYPWLAEFFLDQHRLYGDPAHLRHASEIATAYYRAGGTRFLAFWDDIPGLLEALRRQGADGEARAIETKYLEHADAFLTMGTNLPQHEVNYEQSMVAPLAMLLLGAHRLSGRKIYLEQLQTVLLWLEAFAGQQPHCRLRSIPIRHWDGYWFGRERLWGDVFPHYWSILSASVFLRAGALFAPKRAHYRRLAEDIYRANLLGFFADGGATCAFIFPSAIDGRPAHLADPLANDQDWALVWLLKSMMLPEADNLIALE